MLLYKNGFIVIGVGFVMSDLSKRNKPPKEGDLYKIVNIYDHTFELYYGYYEEQDRYSKFAEPLEIYPDFIKDPIYTKDGVPFVTAIQDVCCHYQKVKDSTDRCSDCLYFEPVEELFGLCRNNSRKKKEN